MTLIAVIIVSIIITFSTSLQSVAVNDNSDVYLGRIVYNLPSDTPINTIGSTLLTKYPGMQNAISLADKEYGDYQKMCLKYDCHNTTITWPSDPTPHFQLTDNMAQTMIQDSSFHFRGYLIPDQNLTSYATYIKYGNATYTIIIIK